MCNESHISEQYNTTGMTSERCEYTVSHCGLVTPYGVRYPG